MKKRYKDGKTDKKKKRKQGSNRKLATQREEKQRIS